MWTRTYLLLLVVRLYFAISPSYIHPDENFQGPEVIAGRIFDFPHHLTWEFTSDNPVRSVFPLWPAYGLPMVVLQWIWTEIGKEGVAPEVVYYTMRVLMFILSFVLEDWALHELIQSPRHRRLAVTLVASSYATWTYQTHTFSNSIETLVVLWSLVMIQRVLDNKQRASVFSSTILGVLFTFGIFNRITFPAFILLPGLYLLPHFLRKYDIAITLVLTGDYTRLIEDRPLSLLALSVSTITTSLLAITIDTRFYRPATTFSSLLASPILTPLNSLHYNTQTSNLSIHGLHPHYQHLIVSLPLLLGPALLLIPTIRRSPPTLPILSALSGTILLSTIPHQEARFLLPAIPLILSSVQTPRSKPLAQTWLASWIIFNALLGILMGVYHQGGVVPTQTWLGTQKQHQSANMSMTEVFWWRTYSPPVWLLDHNALQTTDLMGMPVAEMQTRVATALGPVCDSSKRVGLVAPWSSLELDTWSADENWSFEELWRHDKHLNLDDLDIGAEGVAATLRRVVGRRGLVVWAVGRACHGGGGRIGGAAGAMGGDW